MYYSIAIDGPAGAGKSTISKKLAENLGFDYLDTGAMYRAITYYLLKNDLDYNDEDLVNSILDNINITIISHDVILNDVNVNTEIRTQEVTNAVSKVSSYKNVRAKLVELQRKIAENQNIVVDGRDIGTVVLPNATLKIFLTASVEERARRRLNDSKSTSNYNFEEIKKDIERRDYFDSHREISPLKKADDAVLIDSSDLSIEETVSKIESVIKEKL